MTQAREKWVREWATPEMCPHIKEDGVALCGWCACPHEASKASSCALCGYLAGLDRGGKAADDASILDHWEDGYNLITGRYEVDDE